MKKMDVQVGDTAIDVCAGTCDWAIALAKASKTGEVVGLDFSEKMLDMGRKKVTAAGLENQIHLRVGDAMHLPFSDNSFDHATIGFALRNVDDLILVLKEMKRVVKPGGQVAILELSHPTWPVFKQVYLFYFRRVVPYLGYLFVKRFKEYGWLPESLTSFPDFKNLCQIMQEQVGLTKVTVFPFMGGVAALHLGRKPVEGEEVL